MPAGTIIPSALRDFKRYVEILGVLVKHGFGDLVHDLELESLLERGMALIGSKREMPVLEHVSRPVRVRLVLEELGTTFIKLGQVLSLRPDLVPPAWANEFRTLQANCNQVAFGEIEKRIRAEFPGKKKRLIRRIVPEPLAAASIAQVHRAVLKDGTPVLLKILRPGVEERVEADLAILASLAKLTEQHFSNLGYSPTELVSEFKREIHREIDLVQEGRAMERFRSIFEGDDEIVFPRVYWQATTSKVLAEEEIQGTLLSDPAAHKLSPALRRKMVANATRAVLCQCLEAGYFHADPHPGNLFALSHGRIAFIDCGMIGQLDDETMGHLADLVTGVISGDAERVTRAIAILTEADLAISDSRAFRVDIRELISHFEHTSLGMLDIGVLLRQFFELLRKHQLRCPGDLVLLIKALTTIQAVGKEFDPDFDFVSYAAPYVEKLVEKHFSVSAIRSRIQKSLVGYAELAETLPDDMRQIVRQIRTNKLSVGLEHRGLPRLTSTIEHASRNISFSLIVAAMLIGSSILVLSDRQEGITWVGTLGLFGFGFSCLLLVIRFLSNRKFRG